MHRTSIWGNLTGAARRVAKNLKPQKFTGDDGMDKLLAFLRNSPLGRMALPDAFGKLDAFHECRRHFGEAMQEYIVREEAVYPTEGRAVRRRYGSK